MLYYYNHTRLYQPKVDITLEQSGYGLSIGDNPIPKAHVVTELEPSEKWSKKTHKAKV